MGAGANSGVGGRLDKRATWVSQKTWHPSGRPASLTHQICGIERMNQPRPPLLLSNVFLFFSFPAGAKGPGLEGRGLEGGGQG